MWLLVLLACPAPATVVNGCDAWPDTCVPCATDAECAYGGNACTETVYCAHVDQPISVVEIGCDAALEHPWPPAETCTCVDGTCRSDE